MRLRARGSDGRLREVFRHLGIAAAALGAVACGPRALRGPTWVGSHEPIAALGDYDCVVSREGRLACASESEARPATQLGSRIIQHEGNGAFAVERAPLRFLALPPVREVAMGRSGMCALTRAGRAMCWGFTSYEESPICKGPPGANGKSGELAMAVASGISQIATSREGLLCRLDTTNVLRCANIFDPSNPFTLAGVKQVVSGGNHFCALTQAGSVICWGNNESAQCAAPPSRCVVEEAGPDIISHCTVAPHRVALPEPAIDVTAGPTHTCAVLRDGRVFCWGSNSDGALGFDSKARCPVWEHGLCALEPQAVPGVYDAVRVRASKTGVRTWALLSDGSAVAWPSEKERSNPP